MKKIIYIFSLVSLLISCGKAEDRPCWKSVGEESTKEIELGEFDRLTLYEHLNYVLVQDSAMKIVLKGGKNLLNFVETKIEDGLLEVRNENRCGFLRDYSKKITVEIHFKDLINIRYQGSGTMTNQGKLKFGWLTFLIIDGAGPVNLDFDAQFIHATISHGWGDFTFSGKVNAANLNIRSNGYCDTYGMQVVDSLTVISRTQGHVRVNADGVKLKTQTEADGNIYYKGVPTSILFNQYGTGELIDAN